MSRVTNRTLAGTALSALVFAGLATAVPAHADNSCTVNGDYLRLRQAFGNYITTTTINAKGSSLGPGVVTVPPSGTNGTYGSASGSISGRNIDVRITWNDNKGTAHFTGTIGDDGIARGDSTGTPIPINLWNPGPWYTSEPLNCSTGQGTGQSSAKVVADVDVYNIPDGPGKRQIGTLRAPSVVPLVEPCTFDAFCHVSVPNMDGGNGFAWAPGLLEPA